MAKSHFATMPPQINGSNNRYRDVSHYQKNRHRRKRRGAASKIALLFGVCVLAVLIAGGIYGYKLYASAKAVKAEAKAALAEASDLAKTLKDGNTDALDEAMSSITTKMDYVYEEVNTPLWDVAEKLPVVGEDISSVRTLAGIGETLIKDALVPLANELSGVGLKSIFSNGAINVDLLSRLIAVIKTAMPELQSAISEIDDLPDAKIPQVATYVSQAKDMVSGLSGTLDIVEPYLDLILPMVGAEGLRTYLVIAQNNAELRTTGGLPGSWITLSFDSGVIEKGEATTVLHWSDLQVATTDEEKSAIATNYDTDPAQVNCTANFVRVGEMAHSYWMQAMSQDVDGVIAIDPIFLQTLLGLVGGFEASDGTYFDTSNTAEMLLHGVYTLFGNDGEAQDEYFSEVASAAFNTVMSNLGEADLSELFDTVMAAGEEGRLLMWFKEADEEAAAKILGFAGEIGDDPTSPVLGVYLNDDTYSKISWYCSVDTVIGERILHDDGSASYPVTTTITNHLTTEEASTLPTYIYGNNPDKRSIDDMLDFVFFYAPAGGSISDMSVSEGAIFETYGIVDTSCYGVQILRTRTHLLAGESAVFSYTVTVSAMAEDILTLRTTPLAQAW